MVYSIVKLELFACHSLVDFLDKLSTALFGRLWTLLNKLLLLLGSVHFTVRNTVWPQCKRMHIWGLRITPTLDVRLLNGASILYLFWEWPGDRGAMPLPLHIHTSPRSTREVRMHSATNTSSHSATMVPGISQVIEGADRVSVMRRRTSAMRQPFTHINRHRYLSLTIAN
jgi:hypothetical protein